MTARGRLASFGILFAVLLGLLAIGVAIGISTTTEQRPTSHVAAIVGLSTVPPPSYDTSCDKTAVTTAALIRCVDAQVAELDRELTRALSVESTYFGKSGVERTEQKWSEFSDSECDLEERPYTGGSFAPVVYGTCERGLVVARIDQIRDVVGSIRA